MESSLDHLAALPGITFICSWNAFAPISICADAHPSILFVDFASTCLSVLPQRRFGTVPAQAALHLESWNWSPLPSINTPLLDASLAFHKALWRSRLICSCSFRKG
ncbi:hypothetical protein [Ramlibacter humi]|uniref:Uncharacterized protein n=1 Tax=Ramlibacter humi TaxID=2530451 RepID=A0A4Z0BCY2_9BURK|nr:hypothetical protein [Ramlibacter humi]TFY97102.1 hypothetical protein EZ216_19780 [Ramlibacter humi]